MIWSLLWDQINELFVLNLPLLVGVSSELERVSPHLCSRKKGWNKCIIDQVWGRQDSWILAFWVLFAFLYMDQDKVQFNKNALNPLSPNSD